MLDENGSLSSPTFAVCVGVDFAWTRVRTVSPQVSIESPAKRTQQMYQSENVPVVASSFLCLEALVQIFATNVSTVRVGGSGSSGAEHSNSHSPLQTEQRVVVPSEVPQDPRSSIEDMEISQLRMKREVREVQGVSLDADKRELKRLARDSADQRQARRSQRRFD